MTAMVDEADLKGIWAYTDEELRPPLLSSKDGARNYHLKVREAEVGEWEDGRTRVDLRTEVVCGEHVGQFGPRITLTYGGFQAKSGRTWTTEQAFKAFFVPTVRALHPAPIEGVEPPLTAEKMSAIGAALLGAEFIGAVVRQGDYDGISKVFPMTKMPEGFYCEHTMTKFSLGANTTL